MLNKMVKIESEAELLLHLKNMKAEGSVSTLNIPGVGTFKILFQKADDSNMEKNLQDEALDIIVGEDFSEWKKVLMILERDISSASFETWLKGTTAVKVSDRHVCINFNNSFQLDWVKKHYYGKILSTVEEVTGMEYFLEFQVVKED